MVEVMAFLDWSWIRSDQNVYKYGQILVSTAAAAAAAVAAAAAAAAAAVPDPSHRGRLIRDSIG